MELIGELRAVIESARRECEAFGHKATERRPLEPPTVRGASMGRDDLRDVYTQARAGRMGSAWHRLATHPDVESGVFLWFWRHWSDAPTDTQLAAMWPGVSDNPAREHVRPFVNDWTDD